MANKGVKQILFGIALILAAGVFLDLGPILFSDLVDLIMDIALFFMLGAGLLLAIRGYFSMD